MDYKLDTLSVYTLAEAFSNEIWFIVDKWNYFRKDTVGKQLVRSADSISANIAEGYGRHFYGESQQFYYYSRGALTETQSWLRKAKVRMMIEENDYTRLIAETETIHAKLNGYIKWLRSAKNKLKPTIT
jgi:four helix bundle protein